MKPAIRAEIKEGVKGEAAYKVSAIDSLLADG